jgi:hypothetical protein
MIPSILSAEESPVLRDDRLAKTLKHLMRQKSARRASNELFSLEFSLIELFTSVQLKAENDPSQNILVDELGFLLQTVRTLEETPFYSYRAAYTRFIGHLSAFCRDYVASDDTFGSTSFQLERRGNEAVFREVLS